MDVEDDLSNITANSTDELYHHQTNFYERLLLELFTVVGLVSIACNFLIFFVIVKYRKLRQEVSNIIIAHICVLQSLFLLITPLSMRVGVMIHLFTDVQISVLCAVYEIESLMMGAVDFLLFLLLWDWYLKLYHRDKYVKFCRIYKFLVGAIYVLVLLGCSLTTQFCVKGFMLFHSTLATVLCSVIFTLVLIVINIVHAFKKRRLTVSSHVNVGLAMGNIYVLLWCPCLLTMLLHMVIDINAPIALIVLVVMGFSTPIFNAIYLFRYENNFNVFFKKVLTCKCNDYENETFKDQPVTYSDANGVHIS